MIKINKIYITNCTHKQNKFQGYLPCCCIEDAIETGKTQFVEMFYEKYDHKPSYQELENFIHNEIYDPYFSINIISGNRLIFDTTDELMGYFFQNIKNIPNEEIYDFLLSLVEDQTLFFDYNGKLINSEISSQCPREECGWDAHIEFTEESCKDGKYKFTYNDRGIDTLYNSKWYKNE